MSEKTEVKKCEVKGCNKEATKLFHHNLIIEDICYEHYLKKRICKVQDTYSGVSDTVNPNSKYALLIKSMWHLLVVSGGMDGNEFIDHSKHQKSYEYLLEQLEKAEKFFLAISRIKTLDNNDIDYEINFKTKE